MFIQAFHKCVAPPGSSSHQLLALLRASSALSYVVKGGVHYLLHSCTDLTRTSPGLLISVNSAHLSWLLMLEPSMEVLSPTFILLYAENYF